MQLTLAWSLLHIVGAGLAVKDSPARVGYVLHGLACTTGENLQCFQDALHGMVRANLMIILFSGGKNMEGLRKMFSVYDINYELADATTLALLDGVECHTNFRIGEDGDIYYLGDHGDN